MPKIIKIENCINRVNNICKPIITCPFNLNITIAPPIEGIHEDCPLPDYPDVEKMMEEEAMAFMIWFRSEIPIQEYYKTAIQLYWEYLKTKT